MCGEKNIFDIAFIGIRGSPPHVRGKGSLASVGDLLQGITPACAGKSPECAIRDEKDRDHPRMCGEKPVVTIELPPLPGSPPHVRGKESTGDFKDIWLGITPACAGKSLRASPSWA